ncbi:hypothetical protein CN642_17480 [Bacillus toyonensis]|nr:hypothetical protein A6J74_06390 [Bacillus sp. FDAARGOS_235]PEI60257.1 hypothetical protein CN642_17480 [Bacillus toyonensis]
MGGSLYRKYIFVTSKYYPSRPTMQKMYFVFLLDYSYKDFYGKIISVHTFGRRERYINEKNTSF